MAVEDKYQCEVTVKSVSGKCIFGHKVGDKIFFDGRTIKGDICYEALSTLLHRINAMRFGVDYPFAKDDHNVINTACVDPYNTVVFEVKRIVKKE